jgi:DNA-binding CsgD family transcriptional regulator
VGAVLEERAFSEIKRLCCGGLEGPELLREVAHRLRRVVPFDAYCATTLDPASGLITHARSEEMGGEEEAALFFDRLYFEHELGRLKRMKRERRPVELLSDATGGRLDRSVYYREMLAPLGYAYQVRGAFADGGSLWGTMHMPRERGRPDFTPREVAFLERIAPHLGAGLKTAALRLQSPSERGGSDVPGVLTLDRRGRVAQHTRAAERWLRELEDLGPGWREGVGLPPAVRMVAGALQRALEPDSDRDLERAPRLRVRTRAGRWLTLHGSLTEPAPDQPGGTVIVIEPSKAEEVVWLNVAAYGLSSREEEVVKLVVRGASTRQISRSLFISEHTVQNHLSNVFEKVGVRSRRELVKRLFFDNLYPALFG